MSPNTLDLSEDLTSYIQRVGVREMDTLRALREETAKLTMAQMQIAPEQGQLLQILAELIGARNCLEVGTFTGYSALAVALVLPSDGRLIACDINDEWTSIGKRYWEEAGVSNKIDLRLGPAIETLSTLVATGKAGQFDFAFIDADKTNYDAYYEYALELLRPGGLITIDNVLWSGAVIDMENQTDDTRAIRALNQKISRDERVTPCLVPIGDGITLARKRSSKIT
ncbi:MAG: class I SAM-dependent methyltransferase [Myxococcales bacterium]|nr:class I SAM-dependent methyltransferase [Myxococcales bacterium]